jgi:hypothetical protein
MANPRSGFFQGLLNRPSRILSISGKILLVSIVKDNNYNVPKGD